MGKKLFIVALGILVNQSVWARVFSFENETMAPYFRLRSGFSSMGNTPYRWQGATRYGGDEVDLIYGGEFGFYYRVARFGVALGVLVHSFDPVMGGRGSDVGGARLYDVDVEGLAYGPQVTFDYQFTGTEDYLWKIVVGGGYQFAKLESTYRYTVLGQALTGGQSQLTESYKQEAPFAIMAISTEFLLADTTTISITAGYHYSLNQDWNYSGDGQNFAGPHGDGDPLVFEDGSRKTIDWSYPFVQLGFHFYVDTIR
jgi:hypothetical protein